MIQVIHGEIWGTDFTELDQLIRDFQSCVRFSYCRFSKDGLEFNDVRKVAKAKYPTLNTRQVSDAVLQGQTHQKLFLVQQEALAEKKTEIEAKLKKKLSARNKERLEKRLQRVKCRLEHPKLVFGGRKAWEDLKAGVITKDQWLKKRDGQIYCRGDKTQKASTSGSLARH